ncbi:hypothetical protein MKK58_04210 [Methylobacterium sp. J-078]|uniref:hypothetical protein n=1 Tax=Methylobacterium sp. J-078 TaxID=2836657 RepID=UPI001FB8C469|nr:hypothetical protein [Methylobacterium sp. J-078]MCJ2043741.1 hypothetical protein [Methylobacterium sp. J-078]
MAIKIPVFLSAPTSLSSEQRKSYDLVVEFLKEENLEGRALGRTDFPDTNPLSEVLYIARSCFGGIILGFQQAWIINGFYKVNTPQKSSANQTLHPTPWNHLEAGILFALGKPLLILREEGVVGGLFDTGSSDSFLIKLSADNSEGIREGIRSWSSRVRTHYRS